MMIAGEKRRLVIEQAARWFLWLRDQKAEPAQVEVFQRWCKSNAGNRRAYEKVEQLWQACNGMDPLDLPWPSKLELEQDRYDGSYALPLPKKQSNSAGFNAASAVDTTSMKEFVLSKRPLLRRRYSSNGWRVAAAIGVIALLLAATAPSVMEWATEPEFYLVTAVAEQNIATLDDGTVVTLGGASQLSIQFSHGKRQIILEQGEVFFEVAKDAARPFIVLVGNSEVQAVGTSFNINRRDDAVTVSVIEGVVDVTQKAAVFAVNAVNKPDPAAQTVKRRERLNEGQILVFDRAGELWQAKQDENLERATGWRQGRLAYVNESLKRVLQDINRYSPQKIVIGDWELGELRYTGTVFSNDIDAWLKGLEQAFALRTLVVDDRAVLVKDSSKRT